MCAGDLGQTLSQTLLMCYNYGESFLEDHFCSHFISQYLKNLTPNWHCLKMLVIFVCLHSQMFPSNLLQSFRCAPASNTNLMTV